MMKNGGASCQQRFCIFKVLPTLSGNLLCFTVLSPDPTTEMASFYTVLHPCSWKKWAEHIRERYFLC